MKIGFYPGSFDPITFGHLDIIDRGAITEGALSEEDRRRLAIIRAEVLRRVEDMVKQEPAVRDVIGILGFSVFYRYANQGFVYVTLKDWGDPTSGLVTWAATPRFSQVRMWLILATCCWSYSRCPLGVRCGLIRP